MALIAAVLTATAVSFGVPLPVQICELREASPASDKKDDKDNKKKKEQKQDDDRGDDFALNGQASSAHREEPARVDRRDRGRARGGSCAEDG